MIDWVHDQKYIGVKQQLFFLKGLMQTCSPLPAPHTQVDEQVSTEERLAAKQSDMFQEFVEIKHGANGELRLSHKAAGGVSISSTDESRLKNRAHE